MKALTVPVLLLFLCAVSPVASYADCWFCWQEEPGSPGACDATTMGVLSCIEHSTGCWTNGECGMAGPGGCFLAGTLVLTEKGEVPIEDLQIGDRVIVPGAESSEVVRTHRVIQGEYFVLNGSTRVTGTHPFLTDRGWVTAEDLRVGDILVGTGEDAKLVVSIERRTAGIRAYNIEVGGNHTFLADGYLVHNKPPDPGG